MKLIPQRNLMLLEIKKQDKTDSGLIITSQDVILERATVLEVGPEVQSIRKGMEIVFKAWAIDKVTIDGKDYIHLEEDKVLSVIEK